MEQLEAEEEAQALGQEAEKSDMSEENSYDNNPRYDESNNWIPSSPEPNINSDDEKQMDMLYWQKGFWRLGRERSHLTWVSMGSSSKNQRMCPSGQSLVMWKPSNCLRHIIDDQDKRWRRGTDQL